MSSLNDPLPLNILQALQGQEGDIPPESAGLVQKLYALLASQQKLGTELPVKQLMAQTASDAAIRKAEIAGEYGKIRAETEIEGKLRVRRYEDEARKAKLEAERAAQDQRMTTLRGERDDLIRRIDLSRGPEDEVFKARVSTLRKNYAEVGGEGEAAALEGMARRNVERTGLKVLGHYRDKYAAAGVEMPDAGEILKLGSVTKMDQVLQSNLREKTRVQTEAATERQKVIRRAQISRELSDRGIMPAKSTDLVNALSAPPEERLISEGALAGEIGRMGRRGKMIGAGKWIGGSALAALILPRVIRGLVGGDEPVKQGPDPALLSALLAQRGGRGRGGGGGGGDEDGDSEGNLGKRLMNVSRTLSILKALQGQQGMQPAAVDVARIV